MTTDDLIDLHWVINVDEQNQPYPDNIHHIDWEETVELFQE